MPIIKHDNKDINYLDHLITKTDGEPLFGEIDIYKRIINDCKLSPKEWHFWHDLRLPIKYKGKSEIQIDFLLVCDEGIIIIEVKGGKIDIIDGDFFYNQRNNLTQINESPFDQANNYKWALISNNIFNKNQVFLDSIVAFPHSNLTITNPNKELDLSHKLWNKQMQENKEISFADFCLKTLQQEKTKKRITISPLNKNELNLLIKKLLPTIKDTTPYSNVSTQSIIDWLKIDSINTLNSLERNSRIVIEGGPGTGKTTIAKAYIKKHSSQKGIYICWNKLLATVLSKELKDEEINNCDVYQYESFLLKSKSISYKDFNTARQEDKKKYIEYVNICINEIINSKSFIQYDYIIIDEAQDILDLGIDILINDLVSIRKKGIEDGIFLVFYDIEQGYNNTNRQLDDFIEYISSYATHFKLNENKRVPTNKEIVKYANSILNVNNTSLNKFFIQIENDINTEAIIVKRFDSVRNIIKYIRHDVINNITNTNHIYSGNNCVLLLHSSLNWLEAENGEIIAERLYDITDLEEINEDNITSINNKRLPFTTILKYKGLESKYVFLMVNKSTLKENYELYIGMSRAVINLQILILE